MPAPRPPVSEAPRTNAEHLGAALDSLLAFHGLRPHVTVQVAAHLERAGCVMLAVLPLHLQKLIRETLR